MPKVIMPSSLRRHIDNKAEVEIEEGCFKDSMEHLMERYPKLRDAIDGFALMSVFVNGNLLSGGREEWETLSLKSNDEISLIIPIAGG